MENINLPITGICSFAKYPICTDMDTLDADIAVLGVPYDQGAAGTEARDWHPGPSETYPLPMPEVRPASTTLRRMPVFGLPIKLWTAGCGYAPR